MQGLRLLALQFQQEFTRENITRQVAIQRLELRVFAREQFFIQHDEPDVCTGGEDEGVAATGVGSRLHLRPPEDQAFRGGLF